jgi:hypothetical protein
MDEALNKMYAMYIPLNIGLHWVLCEVVLPRSSTSAEEQYPTWKLKIYDSLHAGKSAYNKVMNLLIEHLDYVWMCGRTADMQTNAMAMKAKLVWTRRWGKLPCRGSTLVSPSTTRCHAKAMGFDCGLFTYKAVENLVDCLPLAGSGNGSRRGGFSAGPNASMKRRRLIVSIGQDAGWTGMAAAAP